MQIIGNGENNLYKNYGFLLKNYLHTFASDIPYSTSKLYLDMVLFISSINIVIQKVMKVIS